MKIEEKKLVESSVFVLLITSIVSRLLILVHTTTVLGVDAYVYIYKANQFSVPNLIPFERGYVFTLMLRNLFALSQDLVLTSRLFTILLSVLLIIMFYLIGKRFLGYKIAFVAAVLACFETQFIIFSTIPYTETFLSLLIFAGFYASSDSRKLVRYILFPVVLGLATLTRIEAYFFFAPSIMMFMYSERERTAVRIKRINLRALFPLILYAALPLIAYGIFSQTIIEYYFTRTRFDPLQRALIFLKPSLLRTILDLTFAVFSDASLNFLFALSVILGVFFATAKYVRAKGKKFLSIILIRNMLPFSLMLFFCLYTIFITMYAPWGIVITGSQVTVIGRPPSTRYVIMTKLLLFYPFAYFICKCVIFQVDSLFRTFAVSSLWNLRLKKWKLRIPLKTLSVTLIITVLVASSSYITWKDGLESASVKDEVMKTFALSANWLSENMKDDEIVIVPIPEIFAVERPDLEPRMFSYETFWNYAGVKYSADITDGEVLRVWEELVGFILVNNVKYMVRDWIQVYCSLIFQVAGDKVASFTTLVKEAEFTLPDGYTSGIRIYEIGEKGEAEALLLGSYYEMSSLADAGSNTSLVDNSQNWIPDSLVGLKIKIVSGTNRRTIRTVITNTANTVTVGAAWPVPSDNTSRYILVVDDADHRDSWSLSEGNGVVVPIRDNLEGLANVYAASSLDSEKFGVQYDLGASGFNASGFKYLVIPAKISTVRSADGIYLVDTLGNSRKWDCWLTTTWTMYVLPLDKYDSQDVDFDITAIQYVRVEQKNILREDRISVDAFWFGTAFSISRAEATTNWEIISGEIVSLTTDSDRQEGMLSVRSEVVSDLDGFAKVTYNTWELLEFSRISTLGFWLKIDTPANVTSFHVSLRDVSLKDRYFYVNMSEVEGNTWIQVSFRMTEFDGQTAGFDTGKITQFRFVLRLTPETPITIWIDDIQAN